MSRYLILESFKRLVFFRMASVVNKELLKTIGKMYKGMPKENWSAYHRMQVLFE